MNSAIITGWTGTLFAKMASYTLPLIEAYAARHGAFFTSVNLTGERPPSWHKVEILIQALQQVDQVAWIDSDVVIMRPELSIFNELGADDWQGLVEHHTECGTVPNCGIWVVRKEMLPVLQEAWNSGKYIDHPWWEQAAIIEKMGYKVEHTFATLEEPSPLYHKTKWLGAEWNHHPSDSRKVEEPRFRHITLYPDRLDAVRFYADQAQSILISDTPSTKRNDLLFVQNLERFFPEGHEVRQEVIKEYALRKSETNMYLEDESPFLFWGGQISNLRALDNEMRKIAQQIECIPGSTIGIFGIGPLLPYLKFSKKKLVVFDDEIANITSCIEGMELKNVDVSFCFSPQEFVEFKVNGIIVFEQYKKSHESSFENLKSQYEASRTISTEKESAQKSLAVISSATPSYLPRVLVQARKNLYQAKGGDTVALRRSCEALENQGVQVVIDVEGRENPREFDIIHLYNFSTPQEIEAFARNACQAGTPFVVTTLYEDLDSFFPKMRLYGEAMTSYLKGEFGHVTFKEIKDAVRDALPSMQNGLTRDNHFVASEAHALIASGEREAKMIKKDFPYTKRIESIHFGSQGLPEVQESLFTEKYGVKDFILCVGRIEWRKNQAILLKAMKDSEMPIVLVAGNMTYQPDYQKAVENYKRRGKTLVVSDLSLEELASAYRAARAHVLPSWFELPGLVSLEAARCGTPVVGTTYGTLSDYLGSEASYCDPESVYSIRLAIEEAINKEKGSPSLIACAEQFTWEATAKNLISLYNSVLIGESNSRGVSESYSL